MNYRACFSNPICWQCFYSFTSAACRKDLQLKLSISVYSSLYIYSTKVLVRALIPSRSPSRGSTEACTQELSSSLATTPGTGLSCVVNRSPTSPVAYPCCYLAPACTLPNLSSCLPLLATPDKGDEKCSPWGWLICKEQGLINNLNLLNMDCLTYF